MEKISNFVAALLCAFVLALALYQPSSEADTRGDTTRREMAGLRATGELLLPKATQINRANQIARGTTGQATISYDGGATLYSWNVYGPNGFHAYGYIEYPNEISEKGFSVSQGAIVSVPNNAPVGLYSGYYTEGNASGIEDVSFEFEVVGSIDPPTDCPSGTHDDGTGNCVPDTNPPTCADGFYWNGTECVPMPTGTPEPTATPTPVPTVTPQPTATPIPTPPIDLGPTPTPTNPSPTATPTPTPSIEIFSDNPQIVAGGWSEEYQDYKYLRKEDNTVVLRDQKPDPHITTFTVTLKDDEGNLLVGETVNFKWDMPGPAPEETRTAITDDKGEAHVDIVSGDTLSKEFDEDGYLLYDNPVKVEATYGDITQSMNLDVLAAKAQWQYKDEQGEYQNWDGSFEALFAGKSEIEPSSLQVALTFGGVPVTGHRINWKIVEARNLWKNPVKADAQGQFSGYGHLSGDYSTTDEDGNARAIYTFGFKLGRLKFALIDSSVLRETVGASDSQTASANFSAVKVAEIDRNKYHALISTSNLDAYTWVKGEATYSDLYAYPAPSGIEDEELLKETLSAVRSAFKGKTESRTAYRSPSNQNGDWWFSQVIGEDNASGGFHKADMSWVPPGGASYEEFHGAAFDIVLKGVPVFKKYNGTPDKPLSVFKPYVQSLRSVGFATWHRWAGEPGSDENELHAIEPAMPFLKRELDNVTYYKRGRNGKKRLVKGQIRAFLDGETGGSKYLPDFPIIKQHRLAVRARLAKRAKVQAKYPGCKPAS